MGRGTQGFLAIVAAIGVGLAAVAVAESGTRVAIVPESQRRARTKPKPRTAEMKFSHQSTGHQLSCDACHVFPSANWNVVRTGEGAFPDVTEFPQHASCLKCHRTEFFARERPAPRICAVCHVAVTPKMTERHAFANPAEAFRRSPRSKDFVSAFAVSFPHERHLELFGEGDSCVNCHVTLDPQGTGPDEYAMKPPANLGDGFWLKKGTFKTSPIGHTGCFTCHAVESGMKPEPRECASCHRLSLKTVGALDFDTAAGATMAVKDPAVREAWTRRDASATFRHEGGLHGDLACAKCHNVAGLDTTDPRSARVGVVSCGGDSGCHVTPSADEGGALNFEMLQRTSDPAYRCTKCHLAFAGSPVPASHSAALAAAQPGKLP